MIARIFRKELLDTLRDRRTLITMLVIPILIFPVIMNVFMGISASFQKEAAEKKLKIGYVGSADNYFKDKLIGLPESFGKKEVIVYADTATMIQDVSADSLQMGLYFPDNFNACLKYRKPAEVNVFFNATEVGMKNRAEIYVNEIKNMAQEERYLEMKLNSEELRPFNVKYQNTASSKEMMGKLAGGILPYIFIAFGFIGCMYPAIDLFTGEKERGTIETILTTPVARWQILFGKMGVVVLSGLLASTFALIGLYLSIEVFDLVDDPKILKIVDGILDAKFIALLFALLIPLTIFFAGIMIPLTVYAKSFKEAQSIITPLNIIAILPAMVGFFPGIELNVMTACIPVVNVVLATKELIAGTLDMGLLGLSFFVMISIALISVFISYRQFGKETNVVL